MVTSGQTERPTARAGARTVVQSQRVAMGLVFLIMIALAAHAWSATTVSTADDYFNGGATNYVFGDKQKAKEEVVTGIQQFPNDPKLNQLMVLLKKEEQQKQQQQNQQKNDQNKDQKQNQNSQKNNSDQTKDQQKSNEQKKNQDQKKQDQAKNNADQKKDQQKQQQKADQKKQDKSEQNPEQEPQQTYAAGQMTPQQAKQLLDAQKGDEMIIPVRPQTKPRDPNKPVRDW